MVLARANTVMGSMGTLDEREAFRERQEVYLPRLESLILHPVSASQTIVGAEAARQI
jgi:hypothetical protein